MRNMILGTDWWTDCDDAVAMRIIARAVKEGKIRLLGIGINACMEYSAASLHGFLKNEGLEYIPVGLDLEATDYGGCPSYQKRLSENFGGDWTNANAEDPVRLYRRLLAEAEEPVEIMEIGFLQVLTAVLKSPGDDISEKNGMELFGDKVRKLWIMAGKWDKDGEKENNFCRNARSRAAAAVFCEICPVEVTFLGWEVGYDVITGGTLSEDDFLHQVLMDHGSINGRCSWDPMLVYMAVLGDEGKAGYDVVKGKASVDAETGSNYFSPCSDGRHCYVVKKFDNTYYENMINKYII